MNRMLMVH